MFMAYNHCERDNSGVWSTSSSSCSNKEFQRKRRENCSYKTSRGRILLQRSLTLKLKNRQKKIILPINTSTCAKPHPLSSIRPLQILVERMTNSAQNVFPRTSYCTGESRPGNYFSISTERDNFWRGPLIFSSPFTLIQMEVDAIEHTFLCEYIFWKQSLVALKYFEGFSLKCSWICSSSKTYF